MSKLTEFLRWWLDEAESDAPYSKVTEYGLCLNSQKWSGADGLDVYRELKRAIGSYDYPFGKGEYLSRQDEGTMHQDPTRLAWVRKYLADHV